MLRSCSRIIALTAMGTALSMTSHAADTTLTLACEGTVKVAGYGEPAPFSTGLIVNLTTKTIHGFRRYSDDREVQLKIVEVKEAILVLRGLEERKGDLNVDLSGFMDRMTGEMTVTATQTPPVMVSIYYRLKCTPTQRMF